MKMMMAASRVFLVAVFFSAFFVRQSFAETNRPVGRATMTPQVTQIPGGARVTAKFHHARLSSPVSLSLLTEVVDDQGNRHLIELKRIDDRFIHSATQYQTERSIDIDYHQLNAELAQKAPNARLQIGPGSELLLFARWMNHPTSTDMYDGSTWGGNVNGNHYWGGPDRGGRLSLPLPGAGNSNSPSTGGFTEGGITSSLDVAHSIDANLVRQFPGLSPQGKVGSRFEQELKLHVDVNDLPRLSGFFKNLAANPQALQALFGAGWTMVENQRYVGQPMVDVYLDNNQYDGAKKGMALRFRTGANVTSLNYKPNDGVYEGSGITSRVEYQVDGVTTANDIRSFVDSTHPMNPMQLISKNIPGATPSHFLNPAARLTDERLKFELTAPSGDQVEISLDHVKAQKLDSAGTPNGPILEFGQLEVEVNHLGAQGGRVVATPSGNSGRQMYNNAFQTLHDAKSTTFLATLGPKALIGGRAPLQFHGEKDFEARSPLKVVNAQNFLLAKRVFGTITTNAFPNGVHSSGQKYAVTAAGLGLVTPANFAPSVKRMLQEKEGRTNLSSNEMGTCLSGLVKLSGI